MVIQSGSELRQSDAKHDLFMTSNPTPRDTLFASPIGSISGFTFDADVAAVFPDMLNRSIPGYNTIITQTGLLAERFAQAGTRCYDLGCSLGATTLAVRQHLSADDCTLVAVDNSRAMLDGFSKTLASLPESDKPGLKPATIELRCEDIADTPIENASVVALNFTLQFVAPEQRQAILTRIADGMVPDGVLILSEKVIFEDAGLNALNIEMYHEFKRANGYSDLEISQKRTALENVLVPDTLELHQQRLRQAGFRTSTVWFQCFNFLSLIALK